MVVAAFLLNTPLIHFPSDIILFGKENKSLSSSDSINMAGTQSTNAFAAEEDDSDWDYEYHETETEVSESCPQRRPYS